MLSQRFQRMDVANLRKGAAGQVVTARGQNFSVRRVPGGVGDEFSFSDRDETILICPDVAVSLERLPGAEPVLGKGAVFITPPGEYRLRFEEVGECFILSTGCNGDEQANAGRALGEEAGTFDPRVAPLGPPYVRLNDPKQVRVYSFADIDTPADNPRMKFIQSSTMSINLVEYEGARDSSKLSPHSHSDVEQASLAIRGKFLHHLRMPWGRDASEWRDDKHLEADDGTILIVPPGIVRTTEGIGAGSHLLIDIFAPPRSDFRAKGWFFNGKDYAAPEGYPGD